MQKENEVRKTGRQGKPRRNALRRSLKRGTKTGRMQKENGVRKTGRQEKPRRNALRRSLNGARRLNS